MSATRNARRKFAPTAASFAAMALLSACVTINVYFPAAEAKEAAKEFVEKVIGDELPNGAKPETKPEEKTPDGSGGGMASLLQRIDPLSLVGIGIRWPSLGVAESISPGTIPPRYMGNYGPNFGNNTKAQAAKVAPHV